jgi:hypothetical protein
MGRDEGTRSRWRLPWWGWLLAAVAGIVALAALAVAVLMPSFFLLLTEGEQRPLRPGPERPPAPGEPTALIIAIDGVDRDLLYDMLRGGELPAFAELLGGRDGRTLPHAHLDETLLAPLPTSTLASWATLFSGVPPAEHGVVGNEYFIREQRRYAGPAPVSVLAPDLVLQNYTDDYANKLLQAPTLYERLRSRDPGLSAWVSMHQFYRGADRLLRADRTVVAQAFKALLDGKGDESEVYASLDREVIDTLGDALEDAPAPRLLTVYLTGTDHYAHGAEGGPDQARRRYLAEVVDGIMRELHRALDARGALADRYVLVLSDHGHTEVRADDQHALSTDGDDDPPAVVAGAGYRLRPFEVEVATDHDYDTVLAYGGAMAYVYVADRSTCPKGTACDWSRPARHREDVLPLAEAFHAASERGLHAPAMRGTLDLILVRAPGPAPAPFVVYLGGGRTMDVGEHLAASPRARYVDVERRLRELAVGPRGHHAGDILLLARNGNEDSPDRRYYFAGLYHSWHGSPSRRDSEIPLIVAHPRRTARELREQVRAVAGERVEATEVVDLVSALLYPR